MNTTLWGGSVIEMGIRSKAAPICASQNHRPKEDIYMPWQKLVGSCENNPLQQLIINTKTQNSKWNLLIRRPWGYQLPTPDKKNSETQIISSIPWSLKGGKGRGRKKTPDLIEGLIQTGGFSYRPIKLLSVLQQKKALNEVSSWQLVQIISLQMQSFFLFNYFSFFKKTAHLPFSLCSSSFVIIKITNSTRDRKLAIISHYWFFDTKS